MRGSAFVAFFGIATAISGSLVGCGDDDSETAAPTTSIIKSGENESCTRTDDCDEDLACVNNICLPSGSGSGGNGGNGGSSGTGGAGKGGTTSSPLGGLGESCTRRADCQTNLGCFNQRCAETGGGEGGEGNSPTFGGQGETCQLTSDCNTGLVCVPGGAQQPGVGFTGVCTSVDTGVAPTGKTCGGAECTEPLDCCELPVELHATLVAKTCADLADLLDGVTCNASTTGAAAARCLANQAYCEGCDEDTWDCTAGRCIYNAACSADGLVPNGCATVSRAGYPLFATCDTADTDKCQPPGVTPLCDADADCDTLVVSDDPTDTCNAGECTCYASMCLRKCDEDFDCRAGFECDTGDDVCVPAGACSSDVSCQRNRGDYRAVCTSANICSIPCENDLDCNPGGFINGQFTQVCDTDKMCKPIGCTDDTECPGTVNGVRLFCTEPVLGGAIGAQSAITD